jgi:hypothetical protein
MKLKWVLLLLCISHIISVAHGCEIKYVFPDQVNRGDTVNLNIVLGPPDCGVIEQIFILAYNRMDTVFSEDYTMINDTVLEAEFIVPDTITMGKADLVIMTSGYGEIYLEEALIIGSEIVVAPDICMVTVDNTNKNMVIWEDPDIKTLDSVYIYKEISVTGNYVKTGAKSAEDVTYFIDTASIPEQNANSYKISFVDIDGYESPKSKYHKTVHLTMSIGIGGACNLIWDNYRGFNYSSFNVYRGTSKNNLLKIAELPTNLFSYTDLAPPLGMVYYVIEVEKAGGCYLGNFKSTSDFYSSSSSNMIALQTSSLKDNFSDESIDIYFDDAINKISILLKNKIDTYNISIISIDGKEKYKQKIDTGTELDISDFEPGVCILKIESSKKVQVQKFIKN